MNPQTSTDHVVEGSRLTPEFVDRVFRLAPAEREQLRDMLSEKPDEPDGTPDELRLAWREEIQRRLEAIDRGEMEMFPPEEVIARVQACRKVRAES